MVRSGQENAFPGSRAICGVEFDSGTCRKVDAKTIDRPTQGVLARRCVRPKNIIWAVAAATTPRVDPTLLSGADITERRSRLESSAAEWASIEWIYDNDVSATALQGARSAYKVGRAEGYRAEVELGYDLKLALGEAGAVWNCDIRRNVTAPRVHRFAAASICCPIGLHHL